MPIQHRSIEEGDLHEPKGIANAAPNTVYLANGIGGGTWVDVTSLIPENSPVYGEMVKFDDATPILPAAGFSTITGMVASELTAGVTVASSAMTLAIEGVYDIHFDVEIYNTDILANNNYAQYEVALHIDGATNGDVSTLLSLHGGAASGDAVAQSGRARLFATSSVPITVDLRIRDALNGGNIVVKNASVSVKRLVSTLSARRM